MNDRRDDRTKLKISIDGVEYTTRDDDQEAAALLRLAGLDPNQYDLAKVKRNGEHKVYRDKHVVELENGDRFVSVRQNAPVA